VRGFLVEDFWIVYAHAIAVLGQGINTSQSDQDILDTLYIRCLQDNESSSIPKLLRSRWFEGELYSLTSRSSLSLLLRVASYSKRQRSGTRYYWSSIVVGRSAFYRISIQIAQWSMGFPKREGDRCWMRAISMRSTNANRIVWVSPSSQRLGAFASSPRETRQRLSINPR
jgi:hypothetical protein